MVKFLDLRFFVLTLVSVFLLASCKPEYDRVRTSGDVDLMLKKAGEYYEEGEYIKAQGLYELLIPSLRGREELEDVYFSYAYTYYNTSRYLLANHYFKNFSTTFTNSVKREEADFMAAFSSYQLSPNFRLDQGNTQKAIDAFELFVNTYPTSDKVEKCNLLIDELRLKKEKKAFEAAKLYYDLRQYQAAVQSFQNLIIDYPDTPNGEEIRYLMVKSAYELADNSIFEKREERFQQAEKLANNYLNKYDDSKYTQEVNDILKTAANYKSATSSK